MLNSPEIFTYAILGSALQLALVLGWIALGKLDVGSWGKWSLGAAFVAASTVVLHRFCRHERGVQLLVLLCLLAAIAVVIIQTLAFTVFLGLAKGALFFSVDQLVTSSKIFGAICTGYGGLAILVILRSRVTASSSG